MNEKKMKILDMALILIFIILVIIGIEPYAKSIIYKSAKGSEQKIVKEVETINDIELMIAQYYNAIQEDNLKGVNEICTFNNKKTEEQIKAIKEKAGVYELLRVKSKKIYQLSSTTYKAVIILKERDQLEDNDNYHEVTINLNNNRKQFKILEDIWN